MTEIWIMTSELGALRQVQGHDEVLQSTILVCNMKGIRVCDSSNSPGDCSGKVNSTESKTLTPLERFVPRVLALAQLMMLLVLLSYWACESLKPSILDEVTKSDWLTFAFGYIALVEGRFILMSRLMRFAVLRRIPK